MMKIENEVKSRKSFLRKSVFTPLTSIIHSIKLDTADGKTSFAIFFTFKTTVKRTTQK